MRALGSLVLVTFAAACSADISSPLAPVAADTLTAASALFAQQPAQQSAQRDPEQSAQGLAKTIAVSTVTAPVSDLPTPIGFGTYDGSGEVVHPDVVSFPRSWNGHRFWSVLTPYPNSAVRFENPSIYVSDDGDSWSVPTGVTNPLARTRRGYLSDPDMVFDQGRNELRLYYREVQNVMGATMLQRHYADHLWLTTSTDAVNWSRPRQIASDTGRFVVSPAILQTPSQEWRMYEVDAGKDGCSSRTPRVVMRRSADGIAWGSAQPVALTQPGYVPWHLDVQYIAERGEYWAMVAAFPSAEGCVATSLFLYTSTDGLTWKSYAAPVLARGAIPQFSAAVYRSTFAFTGNDRVTVWFSGARLVSGTKGKSRVFSWSAAVAHTTATDLLAKVSKTTGAPLSVTAVPGATLSSLSSASQVP